MAVRIGDLDVLAVRSIGGAGTERQVVRRSRIGSINDLRQVGVEPCAGRNAEESVHEIGSYELSPERSHVGDLNGKIPLQLALNARKPALDVRRAKSLVNPVEVRKT